MLCSACCVLCYQVVTICSCTRADDGSCSWVLLDAEEVAGQEYADGELGGHVEVGLLELRGAGVATLVVQVARDDLERVRPASVDTFTQFSVHIVSLAWHSA